MIKIKHTLNVILGADNDFCLPVKAPFLVDLKKPELKMSHTVNFYIKVEPGVILGIWWVQGLDPGLPMDLVFVLLGEGWAVLCYFRWRGWCSLEAPGNCSMRLPFVLIRDLLQWAFQELYFGGWQLLGVVLLWVLHQAWGTWPWPLLLTCSTPTTLSILLQTHWPPCVPSHTPCLQQFFLSLCSFCSCLLPN